jgi:penicillin-binding protein 1A
VAYGDLPGFEDLENPKYDLASGIYDINGEEFGKYFIENRQFIDYDELSPHVRAALFSVEDVRFFDHAGIDFRALVRVAVKSVLLRQSSAGGGSTISQQLAKLLFDRESLSGKSKMSRAVAIASIKFKEWITAVKLEKSYTKEEIVAMYLNKFEFINGAHGIKSAAEIYFGKDQRDLKIDEAATLVGMLKNPARFNPVRFAERTKGRRDVVLGLLSNRGLISEAKRDSLVAQPIDMSGFKRANQSEGIAPYFRSELTKWLKALLLKDEYHKPEGGKYDVYRDGLRIYTTIDVRYQKLAEEALWDHLAVLQKRYWRAWDRKNPLTYEADEIKQKLIMESVDRRVRDTEIYKSLYKKYFNDIATKAQDEFDLDIKEPTIRRLMNDIAYLDEIPREVRDKYRKVVTSDAAKAQWSAFQAALKKAMKEKVESDVFAYNEAGYETKTMTRMDSLLYHLRHLQGGLLSVDPKNGHIKAWVGGADHRYFKFDHVTTRRQVGSTIKPFVYATAIGVQGISPCQEFSDSQYTIAPGDAGFQVDAEWSPSNANGLFTENMYNLYQGLLYSKNSITIRIVKEMGTIELVRDLLDNVGIDKNERLPGGRLMVPRVPSIALGSVDLSLMQMTGGYTTFANNGIYTEPVFIDRIEDKNGKVIYRSSKFQRRALNPTYNAVMVDMLQNNTGGGFGLGLKSPNGGKTGTTNDYADGWFMGITPNLVTGVWVGGDEKWVRFYTLDNGQGFVMARPVYQNYLKKIEASEEIGFDVNAAFAQPPAGIEDIIDCSRYKQKEPEIEQEERLQQKIDLEVFDDEFGDMFDEEFETEPVDTSGDF